MSEHGKNLALRIGSAAVLFPIALWLTFQGGLPFAVLCGAAAAVAAAELVLMFTRLGWPEIFGVAVAGLLPVAAASATNGDLLPQWSGLGLAGATLLLLALNLFRPGPLEAAPRAMAAVALAWLYCGLLISTVVGLRLRFGVEWVILAFLVTWGNDSLAYFAGRAFGRHKLYERVSPKKTWEGFAGGAAGSVLGALVTKALVLRGLGTGACVVIGLGGAVLGPIGDLAESLLKRAAGVKDSGRLIPGHGGLLDRIDALLFVAPWIYFVAVVLEALRAP